MRRGAESWSPYGRVARGQAVGRVEHGTVGVCWVALVLGQRVGGLRGAVAELGAGASGFDDRDADPEGGDLLGDGLAEALDAPLRGVVHGVTGERDLAAVTGQLHDAAAPGLAHVRQDGADQLDRAGEVGGDDRVDLGVGVLLGGAEEAVTGVVHQDVDAAEGVGGVLDDLVDAGRVAYVEDLGAEGVGVGLGEVGHGFRAPHRADDAFAGGEQLFGEVAAEAAAHAGDQPGTKGHPGAPWSFGGHQVEAAEPTTIQASFSYA